MGSEILGRTQGAVRILTLNRPARLNAVNLALYEALVRELEAAADDSAIRCVVVTGAGRAFCAGADLKAHADGPPPAEERARYTRIGQRANLLMQTGTPTIAAVNGHAIGAGLELALSADFMIVARDARLRFPEVTLGTFVGGGVTYTLAERVGVLKARELLCLGEFFSGGEAAQVGVANRATQAKDVLSESLKLAQRLSALAPAPLQAIKRLVSTSPADREGALERERRVLEALFDTRDWQEGIDAFRAGRDPEFQGE